MSIALFLIGCCAALEWIARFAFHVSENTQIGILPTFNKSTPYNQLFTSIHPENHRWPLLTSPAPGSRRAPELSEITPFFVSLRCDLAAVLPSREGQRTVVNQ